MPRDYFNPPVVGNHRRPSTTKLPKLGANYGQKPRDKRRGRRPFGSPR